LIVTEKICDIVLTSSPEYLKYPNTTKFSIMHTVRTVFRIAPLSYLSAKIAPE